MQDPFKNIQENEKETLFKLLSAHIYTYKKGEQILETLKTKNIICIILDGMAQIINTTYNGNEYLIETLKKSCVFGSNISIFDTQNLKILALEKTQVLIFDYDKLLSKDYINYLPYNIFIQNLFNILNLKLLDNNNRIRILMQKSIRDKLLIFFENEYKKTRNKTIIIESSLKELADYLCINRSAMFRELKNLKEDRFIVVSKKTIKLLYTPEI